VWRNGQGKETGLVSLSRGDGTTQEIRIPGVNEPDGNGTKGEGGKAEREKRLLANQGTHRHEFRRGKLQG